jgi:NifU-like protein involved in Fe-S cluster formation
MPIPVGAFCEELIASNSRTNNGGKLSKKLNSNRQKVVYDGTRSAMNADSASQAGKSAGHLHGRRCGSVGVRGEGPYCEVALTLENGIVVSIQARSNGCPSAINAANGICRLAQGREAHRLLFLTPEDLGRFLGPNSDGSGGVLARTILALQRALADDAEESS